MPRPRSSTPFWIELCASLDAYTTSRAPARPWRRTSDPARAFRATASPTRLAIDPPLTSSPLHSLDTPSASVHQSSTCCSTYVAPWSAPPQFGFIVAAIISARTPNGVPVPITHPQKRGWTLPIGYGSTCSTNSAYTDSGEAGPRGAGTASAALTDSGTGCQTGRSRTPCSHVIASSTILWPRARIASQSAGSSVSSGRSIWLIPSPIADLR